MKKFARVLFNIVWVLFIGIGSAISNALLGVSLCLTIIFIPFGIQYFKFIKLVFAPAGKKVITQFSRHPILNVFWLLLGGLEFAVLYFMLGILFAITIIGWPIASQLFKIAHFNIAPFGSEIVLEGEYSRDKNLEYDYDLLTRRIVANGDVVIGINPDGTEQTVAKYINGKGEEIGRLLREKRQHAKKEELIVKGIGLVAFLAPLFIMTYVNQKTPGNALAFLPGPEVLSMILSVLLLTVGGMALAIIAVAVAVPLVKDSNKPILAFYARELRWLMDYYPNGSKEMNHSGIGDALAKYVDSHHLFDLNQTPLQS